MTTRAPIHLRAATLADLRASHPGMRILGLNYKGHEEYNRWGSSDAVRAYVAEHASWLRVVQEKTAPPT